MKFINFFLVIFVLHACSVVNRHIKKAERYTQSLKINQAIDEYKKALAIDKDNYKANAGLGVMLCDYLKLPEDALPYLENAYNHSPKDTSADVIYSLAKSYQQVGEFEKALQLFNKLNNAIAIEDDDKEFQQDLIKRKQDCEYALQNKNTVNPNIKIINLGKKINTTAAEYVPAFLNENEMFFTSKRKDTKNEKINDWDGKYFEAIYEAKLSNGSPESVEYINIPTVNKKIKNKNNRSVISISGNKKYLFIFENNKITQVRIDSIQTNKNKNLSKTINFGYYQNHAWLSKDGKTLYFTSDEEKNGLGGLDIYVSRKNPDNTWSSPENLGAPINTEYDEEAPFLSEDEKTLYFSSKGHKGYGNYDIYKSEWKDNKWSDPINLGQPINSPGQDIYYTENADQTSVYFSSDRKGGYGDMDIYKILYLDKFKNIPATPSSLFAIQSQKINDTTYQLNVPDYPSISLYYPEWQYNQESQKNKDISVIVPFNTSINITYTALVLCDTCLMPQKILLNKTLTNSNNIAQNNTSQNIDFNKIPTGIVSYDILEKLGYDTISIYFDFYKHTIKPEFIPILQKNADILKKYNLSVKIYGYTDMYGSDEVNKKLSFERASVVADFYKKEKVKVLSTIGKGAPKYCNEKNLDQCPDGVHAKYRKARIEVYKTPEH